MDELSYFNKGIVFLADNWDDYTYKTTFHGYFINEQRSYDDLGIIKIGVNSQIPYAYSDSGDGYVHSTYRYIRSILPDGINYFETFPSELFMLGELPYYEYLNKKLTERQINSILRETNDIAYSNDNFENVKNLPVIMKSFFRTKSMSSIEQIRRVINGEHKFENFEFILRYENKNDGNSVNMYLKNDINSLIPSNSFAIIGNNGVGKTSILKDLAMAASCVGNYVDSLFLENWRVILINKKGIDITNSMFITYSTFDFFEQSFSDLFKEDKNKFVGIRSSDDFNKITDLDEMSANLALCIEWVCYDPWKKEILLNSLNNFRWSSSLLDIVSEIDVSSYTTDADKIRTKVQSKIKRMSSGQKIVLSIVFNLIQHTSENSIILIDEPELYLHPPFTLGIITSINEIASQTNSICLMTTHSAVVLQELTRENVFIIKNNEGYNKFYNPKIQTFATSTETINDEIFGLDIRSTGYYQILKNIF